MYFTTTNPVYGFRVIGNADSPANTIEYIGSAEGMTPASMGETSFDYGSWENAFFMPKPCMLNYDGTVAYYLDPDDYSKKLDGTASDIEDTTFNGNAMMEWPLIWYKFESSESEGDGYFYVSDTQVDNTYHCWCNIDSQNNIIPHFYTSIYSCCGINSKMRSVSNRLINNSNGFCGRTWTNDLNVVLNLNTTENVEWYTDVWCDRQLINALLVLICKTTDLQSAIGLGHMLPYDGNINLASRTGRLNTNGLFYGTATSSTVKVFGMENWWGNMQRRIAGHTIMRNAESVSTHMFKLTYGTADGSTVVGYDHYGNDVVNGFIHHSPAVMTDGFIGTMKFNSYGYDVYNVAQSLSTSNWPDVVQVPTMSSIPPFTVTLYGRNDWTETEKARVGPFAYWSLESTEMTAVTSTGLSCKPILNQE